MPRNAHLLKSFVDGELARSSDLILRTSNSVLDQLHSPREGGRLDAGERQRRFELMQALSQHQAQFRQRFTECLRHMVLAELDPAHTTDDPETPISGLGKLQVMDESRAEIEIEVSRAIETMDTAAERELRELQTLTSTLRGQDHVTAESNPLRPQVYAQALWAAAQAVPAAPTHQALLLRLSAGTLAGFLKTSWSTACNRLAFQGATPSIYRTMAFAPRRDLRTTDIDVTQPGTLDALRRTMPHGDSQPTSGMEAAHAPTALELALERIEAVISRLALHRNSAVPAGLPRLADHRPVLLASTSDIVERQIIELLSRLFDVILSDPSLHSPVRRVMARLQVPALRIALSDPGMLDDYCHPMWLLIARITGASAGYPSLADHRLLALLDFSDALVTDLAGHAQQDAALIRNGLARLDVFLNSQLRQQQILAQATADALARAEQVDRLQLHWTTRLAGQMSKLQVDPVIRRFVTGPWARLLTQATLSFGEKDEQTLEYQTVVDELLWSLQLPDDAQSRQRLVSLLPSLLQRLRVGMSLAEMPGPEQQAVLNELMKRHAEVLRPGWCSAPTTPEVTQSPEDIMRRLREEIMAPAHEPAGFGNSLIDLASMDTVPAELLATGTLAERGDTAHLLPPLAAGQRYRIFLHGGWTQVQLLWLSKGGRYVLFAGESPERTHSMTVRALERLRKAGLVKIIDAHSLIQHAVDAMLRKLGQPH